MDQAQECLSVEDDPRIVCFDEVRFRADFDSGNLGVVNRVNERCYQITPNEDCWDTEQARSTRSWFYFAASGITPGTKVTFTLCKINALWNLGQDKDTRYRPVFRIEGGDWGRLGSAARTYLSQNNDTQIAFEFIFETQEEVFFAFSYPYEYQRCLRFFKTAESKDLRVYTHLQTITHSLQGRGVLLYTISSEEGRLTDLERRLPGLFPEDKPRPSRFRNSKPVVLITARVHPGQTPSSFALQGIIKLLLSEDLRAALLLRFFVFMVVPMLNPDGVYLGHYRMDSKHQNLNRHYKHPDPKEQPAIYAVRTLADELAQEQRLAFYFDLHAHPGKRGCFIYGNAFQDFIEQVEAQSFCKLVGMHSHFFQYESCNFSVKHMSLKDKSDELSKQGCGRVVIHKRARVIHSYTLQCGYHSARANVQLPEPTNTDFKALGMPYVSNPLEDNSHPMHHQSQPPLFTEQAYASVGQALLFALLQTFDKNPYSRVPNSQYKSLYNLRRLTAFEVFHQADRFRRFQLHLYARVKRVNELIDEIYHKRFTEKRTFDFRTDPEFSRVDWPPHMGYAGPGRTSQPPRGCRASQQLRDEEMLQKLKEQTIKCFFSSPAIQREASEDDEKQSDDSDVEDEREVPAKKKVAFSRLLDSSTVVKPSSERKELLPILSRQRHLQSHTERSQEASTVFKRSLCSGRRVGSFIEKEQNEKERERQAIKLKLFTNLKLPEIKGVPSLRFQRKRMRRKQAKGD